MHNSRKCAATAGIVGLAMAGLMASPALAAGDDTTAATAIVGTGDLGIVTPAAADFEDSVVTGEAQDTTATLETFSVTDLRGSGSGWHVTAQASTFTGGGSHGPTGDRITNTLVPGSLTMSKPTATQANGTDSPIPTVVDSSYTIDDVNDVEGVVTPAPVQIASAAADEGMGDYDFSATTLTLALPADVYADTYASTVTLSSVTAP